MTVGGNSIPKRFAREFRNSTAPRESSPDSIRGASMLTLAEPITLPTASATWDLHVIDRLA